MRGVPRGRATAMAAALALLPALADPPRAAAADDLVAALGEVCDLVDPVRRDLAADGLAAREGVTADALLAAVAALPPTGRAEPGARTEAALSWDGTRAVEVPTLVVVPSGLDPARPAPVLFVHHGAGGEPSEVLPGWREIAARLGALLVAPAGMNEAGYAFEPEEREALLGALRWVRRRHRVDDDRVWIAGASRGGHVTWDLVLRHPGVFAAAAPMIGGPRLANRSGENNLRYLENAVPLPIRDLQGAKDDPLLLENLRWAFKRLAALKAADARLVEHPDLGHDMDMAAVDWMEFLGGARRDPSPARVVRRAARKGEGRAWWLEVLETESPADEIFAPRVDGRKWAAMTESERRVWMAEETERRTARAEAVREATGRYVVRSTGVKRLRILLDRASLPEGGAVQVTWNGRTRKETAKPDAALLVREFARSLDRAFVPVAEVTISR